MVFAEGIRGLSREAQFAILFVPIVLAFVYYMYADEKPIPTQPLPPGTRPPVLPKDEPWPWETPNKKWPITPR